MDLKSTCTQAEFGELIGVSQQAVSDMVGRGVLTPGSNAREWLHECFDHLREQAAGRGADGELAFQRSELARVSRERAEIKLALERREYAPVALIEQVLSHVGRSIAGVLEPVHVDLHRQCPNLRPEDLKLIQRSISKACDIAVGASLSILAVPDEPSGDDDGDGGDEVADLDDSTAEGAEP